MVCSPPGTDSQAHYQPGGVSLA
uniref:Uncharacterized protein n=1 Tax=Anguilla anguilla TaxID=7936 RepID=A0A0E9PEN4_ANGAN